MSSNIYVGNLSYNVEETDLIAAFEKFGEVASCRIIKDRESGRSKGFAFVEMNNADEANEAIAELNDAYLDDRQMRVNEARPQEKRSSPRRSW